ncbi:MAG TPA: hypothetical protein PLP17_07120 [Oligoflexia bacterium]|nr:hypothetical protein [Oligoflexia bacterium]
MVQFSAKRIITVLLLGADILLFLLSILPNFYELVWENPFSVDETRRGDTFLFVLFNAGAVLYSYAVVTAMVQRYCTVYLKTLRQFRLRRIILFVIAYLSFLSVLINAQSLTGFFPEDMPVRPESGGMVQLCLLISGAASLLLSSKYYKFIGRLRDKEKKALAGC